MLVTPMFLREFCDLALDATSATDALEKIATCGYDGDFVKHSWLTAVVDREKEFPTGLPTPIPVAIPHTDSEHVKVSGIGFFRLVHPVSFGEMGSIGNNLDISIIIPLLITDAKDQVDLLMSVIGAVQDIDFMNELIVTKNLDDMETLFNRRLARPK
jgi:PTS system galactitol-specific IIA component